MAMIVSNVYPQHVKSYNRRRCHFCKKKLKVKTGDVMVTKKSNISKLAHPKCAVEKNWVTQKEINVAEKLKIHFIKIVT